MADTTQTRNYRRGAIMGLTLAEAFILLSFALLLLFAFWQRETVREREEENTSEVQEFRSLPLDWQRITVSASQDGSLEAFIKLRQHGLDVVRLESSLENPDELWRFIDKDEVQRLLDAASRLPEDMQRDLADMIESERAREVLREMAVLEDLVANSQRPEFLEAVSHLARSNLGTDDLLPIARVIESLKKAGSSTQDLEKLIAAMAEDGRTVQEVTEILGNWDDIFGRLKEHEDQRAELAGALTDELGDLVTGIGGRIEASGTIIVPDLVLFESGEAEITKTMARFLSGFCVPWLQVLMDADVEISEARIEGHASSEWRSTPALHEAYLNNLDLSQRRSQAVLRHCLGTVDPPEVRAWARSHLIAVGYSSARPAMKDGREDQEASRRVVFSAEPDPEALIGGIGPSVGNDIGIH